MARRHRRRHFRGYVSLPGLGNIPLLGSSVNSTDVVIGGAAGWAVSKVVEAFAAKYLPPSVFGALGKFTPLATGAAAGAAAYFAKGFLGKSKAEGYAVGAVTVGAALTAANFLRGMPIPLAGGATFSEVAMVNLGRYGGLLVNDRSDGYGNYGRGYGGLLIDDNTNMANEAAMAQMAGISMGEDDDGMYDLVNVPGA